MNIQVLDLSNPLWLETLQKIPHDAYHLPEYVCIEAKRTKHIPKAFLVVDGEKIFFAPYLIRSCNDFFGDEFSQTSIVDVTAPYGYCGILLSEAGTHTPDFVNFAINELKQMLHSQNVCSAFFMIHPILNHNFINVFPSGTISESGETVSIDLTLSEPQIWAHTRKGHQSTINKCKRLGFTSRMVSFEQYMDEFILLYEETMNRVGAKETYYFENDYFRQLLNLGEKIHLGIVEMEDEIACASLFFESCGIVQAHLGGTKTKFLHQSPFNLLLHYVRLWGKERGNKFLHIGGGLGGSKEDSLYTFKSGFSRQRHSLSNLRLIINEEKYQYFIELRANYLNTTVRHLTESNFFPAYRASIKLKGTGESS
jgi:hypothetical protein